ncbi:MAG: hypothetical protein NTV74_07590 [Euryarchaeota archaeon]|nr:hypothetical protein [Euryarchaeota archaeon]
MKIYHKKIIIVSIFVVIVCAVIVSLFYLPKNGEAKTGPLEITLLETASSVSTNPNTYVPEIFFSIGEKVWIYMEYTNISHNGVSDFTITLNVSRMDDGEILGSVEDHIIKSETACFYYFNTNESWPAGLYLVSSKLKDNISGQIAVKSTDFNLDLPL